MLELCPENHNIVQHAVCIHCGCVNPCLGEASSRLLNKWYCKNIITRVIPLATAAVLQQIYSNKFSLYQTNISCFSSYQPGIQFSLDISLSSNSFFCHCQSIMVNKSQNSPWSVSRSHCIAIIIKRCLFLVIFFTASGCIKELWGHMTNTVVQASSAVCGSCAPTWV